MKPFDELVERARADPRRIVLAEGEDPRVLEGASKACREGVARIILLGDPARVADVLVQHRLHAGDWSVIDPAGSEHVGRFADELVALRRHKGMDREAATRIMRDPLYFSTMMVRLGLADGSIGGAVATTAATVRAAIQVIGLAPGNRLVSSFMIMMLCEPHHDELKGAMIFADCALNVSPTAEELAAIAVASAHSGRALFGLDPKIAMLSFSTSGSASHPLAEKIAAATRLVREADATVAVDGEIQLDASLIPEIRARKASGSATIGPANILIFPNLEAGNIAYKLAERIGHARAIGPVLQGLAGPANDLSRGCSADDVYRLIVVTCAQAQLSSDRRSVSGQSAFAAPSNSAADAQE